MAQKDNQNGQICSSIQDNEQRVSKQTNQSYAKESPKYSWPNLTDFYQHESQKLQIKQTSQIQKSMSPTMITSSHDHIITSSQSVIITGNLDKYGTDVVLAELEVDLHGVEGVEGGVDLAVFAPDVEDLLDGVGVPVVDAEEIEHHGHDHEAVHVAVVHQDILVGVPLAQHLLDEVLHDGEGECGGAGAQFPAVVQLLLEVFLIGLGVVNQVVLPGAVEGAQVLLPQRSDLIQHLHVLLVRHAVPEYLQGLHHLPDALVVDLMRLDLILQDRRDVHQKVPHRVHPLRLPTDPKHRCIHPDALVFQWLVRQRLWLDRRLVLYYEPVALWEGFGDRDAHWLKFYAVLLHALHDLMVARSLLDVEGDHPIDQFNQITQVLILCLPTRFYVRHSLCKDVLPQEEFVEDR